MSRLNKRIYLCSSKVSKPHEFFHFILENFLMLKLTYFKNRPRTNFLLIRSFLITTIYFLAYYQFVSHLKFLFMGVHVDPVFLFSAIGIAGYFVMCHSFYQKSNYCLNLYNKIVEKQAEGHQNVANALSVNLANQLLSLDLWGHRVFGQFFSSTLEMALKALEDGLYQHELPEGVDGLVAKINKGDATIAELRLLLWSYQDFLTHKTTEVQKLSA